MMRSHGLTEGAVAAGQTTATLAIVLERLIDIISAENSSLTGQTARSGWGAAEGKNQALRELLALQRAEDFAVAARRVEPVLLRLRSLLEANARLLKIHIGALGEISDLIVSGLRAQESDGTYSRVAGGRSR